MRRELVDTLGNEVRCARIARAGRNSTTAKRGDLAFEKVGDEGYLKQAAIDKIRNCDADQRIVAAIGDGASECDCAALPKAAGALHSEADARQTDFCVY